MTIALDSRGWEEFGAPPPPELESGDEIYELDVHTDSCRYDHYIYAVFRPMPNGEAGRQYLGPINASGFNEES